MAIQSPSRLREGLGVGLSASEAAVLIATDPPHMARPSDRDYPSALSLSGRGRPQVNGRLFLQGGGACLQEKNSPSTSSGRTGEFCDIALPSTRGLRGAVPPHPVRRCPAGAEAVIRQARRCGDSPLRHAAHDPSPQAGRISEEASYPSGKMVPGTDSNWIYNLLIQWSLIDRLKINTLKNTLKFRLFGGSMPI
jgi:hypothetical protein